MYICSLLCKPGTLDKSKVQGKILVCVRGQTDRVDKGRQALLAGAVGMILCNDESGGNEIIADLHVLPASHLTFKDCKNVFAYINSTKYIYLPPLCVYLFLTMFFAFFVFLSLQGYGYSLCAIPSFLLRS